MTILTVLLVWIELGIGASVTGCGLALGTSERMLSTLENAGLVSRSKHPDDQRREMIRARPGGPS